jgi:hypothetical protein
MYFWNIDKLKANLCAGTLSNHEQFKYLLANLIFGPLFFQIGQFKYEQDIDWIFSLAITVGGVVYCYKMNKGRIGHHFLVRFLSIAFVINIRLVIFLLPLMFIFVTVALAFDFGGMSPWEMDLFFLICFCLFEIFYYWRVGFHLNEVSLPKKSN